MPTDTTLKLWALPSSDPPPSNPVARELAGLDAQVEAFIARYTPACSYGADLPQPARSVSGTRPRVPLALAPPATGTPTAGGRLGG
mgnify:CR=1 FL=1